MEKNNEWNSISQILEIKTDGDCSLFRIKEGEVGEVGGGTNKQNDKDKRNDGDLSLSENIVSNDKIFDSSLKNSLKKIFSLDCNLLDKPTCLILIRNNINTIHDLGNPAIVKVADNALKTLDNIEMTENLIYGNYGLCDLLVKIVNFCFKYSPNTKNIVINELANCIEDGSIVCLKGRVQRLVNSLNGVIENIGTKNKNSLNEEMLNKASVIAKSIYNKLSKRARRIIDGSKNKDEKTNNDKKANKKLNNKFDKQVNKNINEDLNKKSDDLDNSESSDSEGDNDIIRFYEISVKKKIKKTFKKEYKNILTKQELKDIINSWIDNIF
jgi:hypothetical protein